MKNVTENIITAIETAMQGEPPPSFNDPAAGELVRAISALSPRDIFDIGAQTLQIILARNLAGAHTEREITLLRDKSNPLC